MLLHHRDRSSGSRPKRWDVPARCVILHQWNGLLVGIDLRLPERQIEIITHASSTKLVERGLLGRQQSQGRGRQVCRCGDRSHLLTELRVVCDQDVSKIADGRILRRLKRQLA